MTTLEIILIPVVLFCLLLCALSVFLVAILLRRRPPQTIQVINSKPAAKAEANAYPRTDARFRKDTIDEWAWREAVTDNAWGLPASLAGTVWIDAGAAIGASTTALLARGADYVYAVEPDVFSDGGGNLALLQGNLHKFAPKCKTIWGALAPEAGSAPFAKLARSGMTTACTIAPQTPDGSWQPPTIPVLPPSTRAAYKRDPDVQLMLAGRVPTITLDSLILRAKKEHPDKKLCLKLSVCGVERDVLASSKELHHLTQIIGHWHGEPGFPAGWSISEYADEAPGRTIFRALPGQHPTKIIGTPIGERVIRNLLYFIYPVRGNGVWQWNVKELVKRMSLFNGKRVVAVALDSKSATEAEVRKAFEGHEVEFIWTKNDPSKWEMVAFHELWGRVQSKNPNELTFYAHAKGVSKKLNHRMVQLSENTSAMWAGIQYEACLDFYPLAELLLAKHAFAGAFKKHGGCLDGSSRWHYSGTFYWARNLEVFKRNWRQGNGTFYGSEAWPSIVCPSSLDGACLFYECTCATILYDPGQIKAASDEFVAWKQKYGRYRMEFEETPEDAVAFARRNYR